MLNADKCMLLNGIRLLLSRCANFEAEVFNSDGVKFYSKTQFLYY